MESAAHDILPSLISVGPEYSSTLNLPCIETNDILMVRGEIAEQNLIVHVAFSPILPCTLLSLSNFQAHDHDLLRPSIAYYDCSISMHGQMGAS
jgi:hypothetical protein